MYFPNTRNNPGRMSNIVPLTQFDQDLAAGVPSFMWISPDQRNDMHGVSASSAAALGIPKCGYPDTGLDHGAIQLGDAFLQKTVSDIMQSSAWKQNSAIVIVWDEDDYGGYPDPAAAAAPPDRTESCSAALWHRPS